MPRRCAVPLLTGLLIVLAGCSSTPADGPAGSGSVPDSRPPSAALSGPTSASPTPASPTTAAPTTPASPAATESPTSRTATATTGTTPSTTPSTTPTDTGFSATVDTIDAALAVRMGSSWHDGCPVPLADLRHLTLTYRGFDGADHAGELVVASSVADEVVAIFRQLYQDGYPIESMRLVDDFGGDDDASMTANNTSAFNCRPVTGGGGFSEHSYGTAIDVNPVQNPYLSGSTVLPAAGRAYLDRPDEPGVIHDGDAVVAAFAAYGFSWGGDWSGPIDYQHFSVTGR